MQAAVVGSLVDLYHILSFQDKVGSHAKPQPDKSGLTTFSVPHNTQYKGRARLWNQEAENSIPRGQPFCF